MEGHRAVGVLSDQWGEQAEADVGVCGGRATNFHGSR